MFKETNFSKKVKDGIKESVRLLSRYFAKKKKKNVGDRSLANGELEDLKKIKEMLEGGREEEEKECW